MRKYKDVVGSFWLPVPGFTGALWTVLGLAAVHAALCCFKVSCLAVSSVA